MTCRKEKPWPKTPIEKPTEIKSVRFTKTVTAALEKAAEAEDRTVSWIIQKAVDDWLKARKFLK